MSGTGRTCEHRDGSKWPDLCGCVASFNVSRGRQYDAEDSCRRHLAAVVDTLMQAEDVPVTVTRIRDGDA
jgi:hypothetical protein